MDVVPSYLSCGQGKIYVSDISYKTYKIEVESIFWKAVKVDGSKEVDLIMKQVYKKWTQRVKIREKAEDLLVGRF